MASLDAEDLAAHRAEWVDPLGLDVLGVRLHELPPNGPGLAALLALGILATLSAGAVCAPEHPDSVHLQIEAMKLAFAECRQHLADPARMTRRRPRRCWIRRGSSKYASAIRADRAAAPRLLPPPDHGTVYISAADRQGRMVSLIQSNYLGFGSGVVVPGTGISLHNRGLGFSPRSRAAPTAWPAARGPATPSCPASSPGAGRR